MPAAQVINLNGPRDEPTALQRTADSFSQRFLENKERQRESDALKEIYGKYQNDAQMLEKSMIDIQTSTELSPTAKVTYANQNLNVQKMNQQVQKQLRDEIKRKEQVSAIEKKYGAEEGSLAAFDPATALKMAKPEKGTQASQPMSEDQVKRIDHVTSLPEWESADDFQKTLMLAKAGVSKENGAYVMKPLFEKAKNDGERDKVLTKKQAVIDSDFVNEQAGKLQSLVTKQQTLDAAEQLNEQDVTGNALDLGMAKLGLVQYTSDGHRVFASYAKDMVKNANIKSIIGSQISQMEFGFFRDATISERFSKEANRQIIKKEKLAIRYDKLFSEIVDNLIEKNGGKIPEGIQLKANKEFAKQSQKISKELKEIAQDYEAIQNIPDGTVLMYDKYKKPLHVPEDQIDRYQKLGASFQ